MRQPPPDGDKGVRRRLALMVEYEGTNYFGFQVQTGQPTIQGALETALYRLTGEPARVRGASRTDSGAHAQGQVVDFLTGSRLPPGTFVGALNYYLPEDIRVLQACEAVAGFHARRSAVSRVYQYRVLSRPWPSALRRRVCYWLRDPLHLESMNEAARGLLGQHDFRPFASGHPVDRSAVRTVSRWQLARQGDTLVIECEANGFLRHQIRRVNSVLLQIGKGKLPAESIKTLLESVGPGTEAKKLWSAVPALPARGLCLVKVNYPKQLLEGNWES